MPPIESKILPRHHAWRLAYRQHQYCKHLSQNELNRRIRDILLRMLTLTPDAKIGLMSIEPEGGRWMELFTHVLEEMVIRHGPYPAGFTSEIFKFEPVLALAGDLATRAAKRLEHLRGEAVVIKFGKPEHMEALYKRGQLRVQAASYYKRADHNGAVRDDELAVEFALHLDRNAIAQVVRNPQDVPSDPISRRLDVRFESRTDYWLYCLTNAVEPRMFVDFEAQACVVIRDTARFSDAITKAAASRVGTAQFRQGHVNYIDPMLPTSAHVDVAMSKHFRYAYQQEYRFVWIPLQPQINLEYFDLELGPLHTYAELISV
jgi:hypothetical protein